MSIAVPKKTPKISNFYARLDQFCSETFGSFRKASIELGMSESYLTSLKSVSRLPSFNVLTRLQPHGLDIYWLFTGREFDPDEDQGKMDNETERAYILQRKYIQERQRDTAQPRVAEAGHGRYELSSTNGGRMDRKTIAELWDELSLQFPGTPLWEQLTETERRSALYEIAKTILSIQERTDRTSSEEGA